MKESPPNVILINCDDLGYGDTSPSFAECFGIPYSNDIGRLADRLDSPSLPLLRNQTVMQ